jgi:yeast amino acid transporter
MASGLNIVTPSKEAQTGHLGDFDRSENGSSEPRKESGKAGARHEDCSIDAGSQLSATDHTHRRLKPRHISLIGIGGSIGTVLFVQVGKALLQGGPASLFLAFLIW